MVLLVLLALAFEQSCQSNSPVPPTHPVETSKPPNVPAILDADAARNQAVDLDLSDAGNSQPVSGSAAKQAVLDADAPENQLTVELFDGGLMMEGSQLGTDADRRPYWLVTGRLRVNSQAKSVELHIILAGCGKIRFCQYT
jgi:hypothetical protein